MAEPPGGSTNARVASRVQAAADALANAGYDITTEPPPRFEEVIATWAAFIVADIRTMQPIIGPMMSDDANKFLASILDISPALDLDGYSNVIMTRHALMREWGMWFTDIDLVLTPAWTQLPFANGWDVASAEKVRPRSR